MKIQIKKTNNEIYTTHEKINIKIILNFLISLSDEKINFYCIHFKFSSIEFMLSSSRVDILNQQIIRFCILLAYA